jgi:hypothetical protein
MGGGCCIWVIESKISERAMWLLLGSRLLFRINVAYLLNKNEGEEVEKCQFRKGLFLLWAFSKKLPWASSILTKKKEPIVEFNY